MSEHDELLTDEVISKCCLAAELMLRASGIRGVKFEPETMKQFIEEQVNKK